MSKYTVKSRFCPGDRIRLEAALEGGKYQGSAEVRIPQPIEEAIRVDTLRTATESRSFHAGLYALPDCHP